MTAVAISTLKIGDILSEDVKTSLGGILFFKNTHITKREITILEAFLIKEVIIKKVQFEFIETPKESAPVQYEKILDSKKNLEKIAHEEKEQEKDFIDQSHFPRSYSLALHLSKELMNCIITNQTLPFLRVKELIVFLNDELYLYEDIPTLLKFRQIGERYIFHHQVTVTILSLLISKWLNFADHERIQIGIAAFIHDIGLYKIDATVMDKPDKLTIREFDKIKRHPILGYRMIYQLGALNEGAKLAVLQHHERNDGSGYPLGLIRNQIHTYSKIISVADTFHAMCSDRPYKKGNHPVIVSEQLEESTNLLNKKYDAKIVSSFITRIYEINIGSQIKLIDGRKGFVCKMNDNFYTRPIINVGGQIYDLLEFPDLHIDKVF